MDYMPLNHPCITRGLLSWFTPLSAFSAFGGVCQRVWPTCMCNSISEVDIGFATCNPMWRFLHAPQVSSVNVISHFLFNYFFIRGCFFDRPTVVGHGHVGVYGLPLLQKYKSWIKLCNKAWHYLKQLQPQPLQRCIHPFCLLSFALSQLGRFSVAFLHTHTYQWSCSH